MLVSIFVIKPTTPTVTDNYTMNDQHTEIIHINGTDDLSYNKWDKFEKYTQNKI